MLDYRRYGRDAAFETDGDGVVDPDAGYRRELTQPGLTGSIVRDARIVELEARLRPQRDWRLIVDVTGETGEDDFASDRTTIGTTLRGWF